jgi:DUF1009 family protein
MAGKFHKALLYQPSVWWRHRPDWQGVKTFYHYFVTHKRDNKDDTLLIALADAFAAQGITFRPATDFAPELLVKSGQIAGRPLSSAQQADIEFGWEIAKQMGGLDIGQSVCVKDRAVLAVEAIEGTDACILRAGDLCKKGDFTVVKVAKPPPAEPLKVLADIGERRVGEVRSTDAGDVIILAAQRFGHDDGISSPGGEQANAFSRAHAA